MIAGLAYRKICAHHQQKSSFGVQAIIEQACAEPLGVIQAGQREIGGAYWMYEPRQKWVAKICGYMSKWRGKRDACCMERKVRT
jgi:hypothetical protein